MNEVRFVLNAEQIKYIESTPDTLITLVNGDRVMVRESMEDVVAKAIEFCRRIRAFRVE
jgi:flagellar protein FlbD